MADTGLDLALLSRVEDVSLNAAAPPQQRWLDGWILRYCPGKARRSRCINAVASGRLPLAHKLEVAAALYRQAEVPMVFRVTRFTEPPELDAELARLGWRSVDETCVLVKPGLTATAVRSLPAGCRLQAVDALTFAEAVGGLRATPPDHRRAHAQRLQQAPVPHQGFIVTRETDGLAVACAQMAQEDAYVGLYDVQTHASFRGQGFATLLCEHMLTLAAQQGAQVAYLQVQGDNATAQRIYRRLGFADGYTYHYREAPQP